MPTITAPLNDLQHALAAVTPHIDVDGWTPVLEAVNVVNDGTDVLLLATDRFTAIEYRLPNVMVSDTETIRKSETFLIPIDAVVHIRDFNTTPQSQWDEIDWSPTYAPKGWAATVEMVEAQPGDLSTGALIVTIVDDDGVTQSTRRFFAVRGSYPLVPQLFPEQLMPASIITASAQMLTRVAKTAAAVQEAFGPTEFTFSAGQRPERNPVFVVEFGPGPVRVVFSQKVDAVTVKTEGD